MTCLRCCMHEFILQGDARVLVEVDVFVYMHFKIVT